MKFLRLNLVSGKYGRLRDGISFFLLITLCAFNNSTYAQCGAMSITAPTTSCRNAFFDVTTSTTATGYEWNFCVGDLTLVPSANHLMQSGVALPFDISVVKEGNTWYSFAVGHTSNTLSRISLGSSLSSISPIETSLGNPGGFLSNPTSIKVKKFDNVWYGLIFSEATRSITLLEFGSSPANTPVATMIASSIGGGEGAIDFTKTGANSFIVVTTDSGGVLNVISYANGLSGGITNTNTISIGGYWVDVEIVNKCNQWSVFVLRFDTKSLVRFDFGSALTNSPTMVTYSSNLFPFGPYRFWMGTDGEYQYGVVTNISGGIANLDIGTDITNTSPVVTDLSNLSGTLVSSWSIYAVKENNNWFGFTMNGGSADFYQLSFPKLNCGANTVTTTLQNPGLISYSTAGEKYPYLKITNSDGSTASQTFHITVQALDASPLQIQTDNQCINSTVTFVGQSTGIMSSPSWDFGDATSSTAASPTHSYGTAATYKVSFTATNGNGCPNLARKDLQIFNPPQANFILPSVTPLCTNQNYTFQNNSTYDVGSNPTWQWNINATLTSSAKDLVQGFPNTNSQSIQLVASLPGCSTQVTSSFGVQQQGPLTDFSITGHCEDDEVQFTDMTVGTVDHYSWDFGDGNTSTLENVENVYLDKGTYNVKLIATNAVGCNNSTTKSLTIYSHASPSFSVELPPFSCSGTPSQLTNTTSNPTDSNVTSWLWSFNDGTNATSTDKDPLHTFSNAGNYNVTLTATTNFNCSASATLPITINAAPPIDFAYTAACLNQGTRFTDQSGPGIKSWLWTIDDNTYAFSNPTHVFGTTGNFTAQLTVVGSNDCIATLSKTINVPKAPTLDFSFTNTCEGQAATFQDSSPLAVDPVASESWDFEGNSKSGSPVKYAYASAGTYTVKMTSTQKSGCSYSLSKSVVIASTPVAKFSATPLFGVSPLNVQFTNQSTGASSYSWRFNDKNNSTSTSASPSFQFIDLGDYVVDLVATNAQGCSNTVSSKISVIVPSFDVELTGLNLVKDPNTGVYRIMVTIKNKSNYVLTSTDVIVDISGNARIKETINTTILPDAEVSQLLTNQIIPSSLFTYLCAELDVANDVDEYNNKKCESVSDEGVIFSPYPNPSNGEFQFDWISYAAGSATLSIINSTGQVVFHQEVTVTSAGLNQVVFDLKSFNEGPYYLKFNSNSLSKTIPIVIAR